MCAYLCILPPDAGLRRDVKMKGAIMPKKLSLEMQCAIGFFIAGSEVARADGTIEKEEIREMVEVLQGAAGKSKSNLVRESARLFAFENDDVSAAYTADKKNHVDFLESLGKSLEKCEVEDLNRYLWAMFVMTSSVANATGGGWLSSQKISDEEAQVAVGIFLLLGQGQSIDTLKVWIEKNGI